MAFTHLIFPEQEIYILIREKANNKMCSVKKLKKIGQAKNAEKEDSGKSIKL
jgi:ribosome biogenesis protein Tsr3